MGSKKARKVAEVPVEVAVPESGISKKRKKKKKAVTPTQIQTPAEAESAAKQVKKVTSEIDDIFGQRKPESAKQAVKAMSEIDDIFGQKKRKKSDYDAAAKKKEKVADPNALKLNSKGELVKKNPQAAPAAAKPKTNPTTAAPTVRKKTEDGFTVYSAEELGFNKKNAGGTKICPFDCDCCF